MLIILIGFMGSGKSAVADCLSRELRLAKLDLDSQILLDSGFDSISSIFDKGGESLFRKIENQVLEKTLNEFKSGILSLGGGTPCFENNSILLQDISKPDSQVNVIYLNVGFEEILRRLEVSGGLKKRPLFADVASAKRLYSDRKKLYSKVASYTVDASSLSVEEVVKKILVWYKP